jgi:hypothetical protein
MNGLINIDANSGTFDEIDCNTLNVALSATAPTRSSGDTTTHVATTQFVQSAITTAGANYVDLTSTQTITGAKTFSNANTVISGTLRNLQIDPSISSQNTFRDSNQVAGICNIANNGSRTGAININTGASSTAPVNIGNGTTNTVISGNLITNNIVSASATTDINIGSALTTGDIRLGNSGGATNVALNWGGSSNSGNLTFQGGSFTLAGTGNYNQSGGATFVANISTTQSSGIMNIGTAGARSGAININTGTTSTAPVNISSATNDNAPITIGSTASTTQTATHNAITTFSKIPSCAVAPTTADHLCNKTYVDSVAGGGVSLSGTNVWTGTNTFDTNLPTSTQTPTTSTQLTTKTYVDSAITTGSSNLLAGTNAWTGTNTFDTNLPTSTQTPTTSTQLTTKTYVDSAITTGSSGLLASKNVWTNENDFTNIVKVQTPSISSFQNLDLYSADNSIVINGAPGTTSALSGVNLNTNTLTVPIKNNQSLIRVRIPMNIAGFGVPSFYFGQLDIIFNSITAITILKNGSFYKTVSVFDLINFTGTTKSWTGWSQKGENARAYVGDVRFELALTTGNTSVDTYTIGITMDVAVNAGAVGLITPRFLCSGDFNFTTTHATTSTGTTYISTDPASYFPYQINFGNSGNYIIGKGTTYLKSIDGGDINIDAWSYIEMKAQNGIDVLAGNADLNLKTLTSGDVNIQSAGATNINSGANTSIQTNVAGGLISLKVSDGTTAIEIQDATTSGQYQEAYIVIPETSRINIIPEGTILTSVVATAPEGYVLCNGASYSSTNVASNKYRRLFNAIGYGFGGSGASFNVPNFQGAFLRGSGSQTVGGVSYAGNAVGNNPQQDAVQTPLTASNQGFFNLASGTARQCPSRAIIGTDPVDTTTGILPRFTRTATENRPFNFTVYYYIKF